VAKYAAISSNEASSAAALIDPNAKPGFVSETPIRLSLLDGGLKPVGIVRAAKHVSRSSCGKYFRVRRLDAIRMRGNYLTSRAELVAGWKNP